MALSFILPALLQSDLSVIHPNKVRGCHYDQHITRLIADHIPIIIGLLTITMDNYHKPGIRRKLTD